VWCGPAMGAFNAWVAGSPLADPEARDVVTVGRNILLGAAVAQRAALLRMQGVAVRAEDAAWMPLSGGALAAAYEGGVA